ncbi:MAG: ABC transporter substrate-binding protein, partial [Saprospiraceae bacterium]
MFRTLTLLIFIVITFSCGSRQAREHKVLRYNQPNHITSLDPAFAKSQNNIWSVLHLFDGLVELDDSLNVSPAIAKSWLISEDGLDYTFYLREDVYFHENDCFSNSFRKVVASDFEYSLTRLIDSKISSPGSWLFTDKIREERPFEAIDDTTFVLHLTRPFIPMLGILTMQYCAVVPQEGITYYGSEFAQNPVGTGAFKFKKWIANQALFLNRNDNYYKGPSKLEG